jgi:tetratricopeptide (TPR) repeat protein
MGVTGNGVITMKTKPLIIVFLFAALMFNNSPAGAGLTDLVKEIQPAVVKIVTYDINKLVTGFGSGFFINNRGHLITNFHVLRGAFSAEIVTYAGGKYPIGLVLAEDPHSDLLKVSVDMPELLVHPLDIIDTMPSIAEQVLVVGSPLGLEQSVSEGIVSAIRELPYMGKFFQTTAPISPGSSGSPVVNMKGHVIGVISFQSVMGQNLNFAISGNKVLALEDQQNAKSIAQWTYALSNQKPKLAEELCRKGFQFSIDGKFKKALSYYKDATQEDPSNIMAWYGLSQCYVGLDQPEQVVGTYKEAIRINIDDETLHYNLGNYYANLEKFQEAVTAYKEALRINPEASSAHNRLGLAYNKLGLFKEAIESHREVLRINPRSANAYYNIGLAYRKLEDLKGAIGAFKEAVEINPDFTDAYKNIGILSIKQGRPEEGLAALKQAIRIDPDDAPAHYHLGLAYQASGDKDAAIQEYKILKRLDSDSAEKLFERLYD